MLKIGITGHRDLNKKFIVHYKQELFNKLSLLQQIHNDIVIYSALADGADRVIIEQAIKLNIDFIAVLPMKPKYYKNDFTSKSKLVFDELLSNAKKTIEIPLSNNSTLSDIQNHGYHRDLQYEKAGQFISDNCDILIALWDGIDTYLTGGTSETVKYFCSKPQYSLYHILVSRNNAKIQLNNN